MNFWPASAAAAFSLCFTFLALNAQAEMQPLALPEATTDQVAREVQFLTKRFFKDLCFSSLVNSKNFVKLEVVKAPHYEVSFPSSELVSDGFSYSLYVQKEDRIAYLVRTGGFGGVHESVGPVPIGQCLQEAFTPSVLSASEPGSNPSVKGTGLRPAPYVER